MRMGRGLGGLAKAAAVAAPHGGRPEPPRLVPAGELVGTAELEPTAAAGPASGTVPAEGLRGKVDAVNCTDNSSAHTHVAPMATAHLLIDSGVEPGVHGAGRE